MLRFLIILTLWLVSCRETSSKKEEGKEIVLQEIFEVKDSSIDDSISKSDKFQWTKWEKSRSFHLSSDFLKYVAKDHEPIHGTYGDIDENGTFDLIVVTGRVNEDSLRFSGQKLEREMLVFLDQEKFSIRNAKAIPCIDCCGTEDSYAGHLATKGKFVINEKCNKKSDARTEYRFDYKPKLNDWLLDTIVIETFNLNQGSYSLDTMTRKDFGNISLKTFDINKLNGRKN